MPKPAARPFRGVFFECGRFIAYGLYRLAGWRVEGDMPPDRKMVVIAAPHTTNWDLPLMLAVAMYYRVPLRWMGKASLGKGATGAVLKAFGLIPIDRSKANDVVSQMVAVFNANDDLLVAIPPEGTRSMARYWKTGFYTIAHGAGVPIALGFLDYAEKTGGVKLRFVTTGHYEADLAEIKAVYAKVTPKFPTLTNSGD